MSAWAKLLAASSLAFGTAWDLITHPKTGGAGVVVSNGATITVGGGVTAALAAPSFDIAFDTDGYAVSVDQSAIAVIVAPGITAQVTQTDIGATT